MDGSTDSVTTEKIRTARVRIPKETLAAWTTELSEWMEVEFFRTEVERVSLQIPRRTFFRQAGLAFLRDAWIASRVACALRADTVHLISSDRPDFEILIEGKIQQFEATEADLDGRRRGDEPDNSAPLQDPVENWRNRFDAIPGALNRVISKKLEKNYSPETNLVIYLNLACYGAYVEEGLPILRNHTAAARHKFKRVFVLWEGFLYKFWEEGEYQFEKWQYVRLEDF
jgi:hypothetical protein